MTNIRLSCCGKCLLAVYIISGITTVTTIKPELAEPYLVFSHALGLKSLNLTSLRTQNLYSHGHHIFDIDILWNKTDPQLFWSEYEKGCVYSGTLQGNDLANIQIVVSYGVTKGSVEGIAVDWIARNLYWVESRYGWIEMINLESKWRSIVVTNIELPRAIALDPRDGLMFWTNWYLKNPKIERSTMSGKNRTTIVNVGEIASGGFPNGLAIDYTTRHIYWIDAKSDSIYSSDYYGNYVEAHLSDHNAIQSPFGLAAFNDNLFWVDAKLNTVNKVNIHNTTAVEVLHETYHSLYGIALLHPNIREVAVNACENNFGCSHLCVLDVGGTAVCKCPAHLMILDGDGKTCKDAEDLLLISEFHKEGSDGFDVIFGLSLNSSINPVMLPIVPPSHSEIIGLELDAAARFVYWADGNSNAIWRASVANSMVEKVLSLGYNQVTGFGADWKNGIVFYSIIGLQQGIHSCSLINYNCTWIMKTASEPRSLKLHAELRKLFWVEKRGETRVINSALFNGSNHTIMFEENHTNESEALNGFTVDPHDNALYWISSKMNSIMKLLSTGDVVTFTPSFTSRPTLINTIIIEGGHILVSDKNGHIFALDKQTGDYLSVIYNSSGTINMLQPVKLSSSSQGQYNPCDLNNGGCEEQCAISTNGRVICIKHNSSSSESASTGFTNDSDEQVTLENDSCQIICHNSGWCVLDESGGPSCQCPLGFYGPTCQYNVCDSYCQKGRCFVNDSGRPICLCFVGYYGDKCQTSLCSDFCLHGKCQLLKGRPMCSCSAGWSGSMCQFQSQEIVKDVALTNVCNFYCLNDGICMPAHHDLASPICSCPPGYSGSRCEIQVAEKAIQITSFAVLSCLILVSLVLGILFVFRNQCKKFHKHPRDWILGVVPKRGNANFKDHSLPREKRNAFCLTRNPLCKSPIKTAGSKLASSRKEDDCITLLEISDDHTEASSKMNREI